MSESFTTKGPEHMLLLPMRSIRSVIVRLYAISIVNKKVSVFVHQTPGLPVCTSYQPLPIVFYYVQYKDLKSLGWMKDLELNKLPIIIILF